MLRLLRLETLAPFLTKASQDITKKALLKAGLTPWENIALVNSFSAFMAITFCLITKTLPVVQSTNFLITTVVIAMGKIAAQYFYYQSLRSYKKYLILELHYHKLYLI